MSNRYRIIRFMNRASGIPLEFVSERLSDEELLLLDGVELDVELLKRLVDDHVQLQRLAHHGRPTAPADEGVVPVVEIAVGREVDAGRGVAVGRHGRPLASLQDNGAGRGRRGGA